MKTRRVYLKGALATLAFVFAVGIGTAQVTITYVEAEPLMLPAHMQAGQPVNVELPEGYRLVINGQPIVIDPAVKRVTYTFEAAGDYEVVTEKRSGSAWLPVSTSTATVGDGTTTSTTTTTTSDATGTKVMKKTTTAPASSSDIATTTKTTTAPDSVVVDSAGHVIAFVENEPVTISEQYIVGQPLEIEVPATVTTEYRWRINNQTVVYDPDTRRAQYVFSKPGEYSVVTERREGNVWNPVYTTKTIVIEK